MRNGYEDIVIKDTVNGRSNLLHDFDQGPKPLETELGGNHIDHQAESVESLNPRRAVDEDQHSVEEEEPIMNEVQHAIDEGQASIDARHGGGAQTKRGPGRPRKIDTGRRDPPSYTT